METKASTHPVSLPSELVNKCYVKFFYDVHFFSSRRDRTHPASHHLPGRVLRAETGLVNIFSWFSYFAKAKAHVDIIFAADVTPDDWRREIIHRIMICILPNSHESVIAQNFQGILVHNKVYNQMMFIHLLERCCLSYLKSILRIFLFWYIFWQFVILQSFRKRYQTPKRKQREISR